MFWNKHLTKLKYVLTLPWEIWSGRLNHWIATNMTGRFCLKNHQTCSKLDYLYMLEMFAFSVYQDLRCRRTETTHREWVNSLNHAVIRCVLVMWCHRLCAWIFAGGRYFFCMWYKDDVTYYTFDTIFETITASLFAAIQWFIKTTCTSCVDGPISHFKFPRVVLAYMQVFLPGYVYQFFYWNWFIFDRHRSWHIFLDTVY